MIRNSANVRKSDRKGLARSEAISTDNARNSTIRDIEIKNPPGLKSNKSPKTKGVALSVYQPLENLFLREGGINDRSITFIESMEGITNMLYRSRVAHFEIQVLQNDIKAIVNPINFITFGKDILGGKMGNAYLRSNSHEGKVRDLGWHANLLDSFEKGRWDGIPRTTTESLKSSVLSFKNSFIGREEGDNIGELRYGEHIIERNLGEQATIKRGNEFGGREIII